MNQRQPDGSSFFDQPIHGWPARKVIWSCTASRGPLLTRYYLIENRWFALYLHHLHASDEDRALHDHPWSFITFLLSSGYLEHTPPPKPWICNCGNRRPLPPCPVHHPHATVGTWRRRFSLLYRPAVWQHRLEIVKPTWTLVLRFRYQREWGFITKRGWLHWMAYGREWCD